MKVFHIPSRGTGSRRPIRRAAVCAIFLTACSPFAAQAQTLLFRSGFEPNTALTAPTNCFTTGCWQAITGTDLSTGYTWPPTFWGGTTAAIQLLADTQVDATTVRDYMYNQIVNVTGHNGAPPTHVLYSSVTQSGCCGMDPEGSGVAQNTFQIQPATEGGDLYMRYWLKYQPDLDKQLASGGWRYLFSWKTGTPGFNDGDYRVVAEVVTWCTLPEAPCWEIRGDNAAGGSNQYIEYWRVDNTTVPVPIGQWFKFEVFWHRSTLSDGRVWMAVNGQVIVDHSGPNKLVKDINRIFVSAAYSSTAYPLYQWVDDLEIWDGFPPDASPH